MCDIRERAAEFEAQHRECIRVLPYEGEDSTVVLKFYVLAGADGIPQSLKITAERCFNALNVKLEWIDLFNDRSPFPPVYSPSEFQTLPLLNAEADAKISKVIKKNLKLFSQHSNITAICPSLKVRNCKQTSIPCIAVYVLGKGCVPLGEDNIRPQIDGYPVDVMDGFWFECTDGLDILDTQRSAKPLKLGVSIGTVQQVCSKGNYIVIMMFIILFAVK